MHSFQFHSTIPTSFLYFQLLIRLTRFGGQYCIAFLLAFFPVLLLIHPLVFHTRSTNCPALHVCCSATNDFTNPHPTRFESSSSSSRFRYSTRSERIIQIYQPSKRQEFWQEESKSSPCWWTPKSTKRLESQSVARGSQSSHHGGKQSYVDVFDYIFNTRRK